MSEELKEVAPAEEIEASQADGQVEQEMFEAAFAGDSAAPIEDVVEEIVEPVAEAEDKVEDDRYALMEDKFNKRIRQVEGKMGPLNETIARLTEEARANEEARLAAKNKEVEPSTTEIKEAMQDGEKMAALREDFPEFADAMTEAMAGNKPVDTDALRDEIRRDVLNQVAADRQAERQALQVKQEEEYHAAQITELDDQFPGWMEEKETNGFRSWLSLQPLDLVQHIKSTKASDAAIVFSAWGEYKNASSPDLAASSRQKRNKLARAVSPTSGSKTPVSSPPLTESEIFNARFNSTG